MVLAFISDIATAQVLLQSASQLASQLGKSFTVLTLSSDEVDLKFLLDTGNISHCQLLIKNDAQSLVEICEELEVSFLFIQLPDGQRKRIRSLLTDCRELRIPYIFYKDSFGLLDLTKVMLPIGFLEEELEKAQFASAFGRFCHSEVKMLVANDYGSKAANNAEKMKALFDQFDFKYTLEKATNDSFKVDMEAVQLGQKERAGMIIISASRDYGLDDILFGPKEYHAIKKSNIPILLVNPRGDLYVLCD